MQEGAHRGQVSIFCRAQKLGSFLELAALHGRVRWRHRLCCAARLLPGFTARPDTCRAEPFTCTPGTSFHEQSKESCTTAAQGHATAHLCTDSRMFTYGHRLGGQGSGTGHACGDSGIPVHIF